MKYGYFTLASKEYVPGAVCLIKSLKRFTSLPINVINIDLSADDRALIESHGAVVRDFPRISSACAKRMPWHTIPEFAQNCFMKLHLWDLEMEYDKVIYLDSDTLVVKNIDHLFELKEKFAACPAYAQSINSRTRKVESAGYSKQYFNAGFLVLEPNINTFGELWSSKDHFINSQDPSDQGLLNIHFEGKWHRLPPIYNATRRVFMAAPHEWKAWCHDIAVIHYTIEKPWVQSVPKCESIEKLWWECYTS
jgi:lipopolysaccharide biosynthesis glycosyltransferase